MLTASRQDIDASCPWNQFLLRAIPVAILRAIQQFNRGPMRYGWLHLLQERPPTSDFFEELEEMTQKLLSQHPILQSAAESYSKPSELCLVPKPFRDRHNRPLLSCDALDRKYISPHYAAADLAILRRLGVRQQSAEEFLSDLEMLLKRQPNEIWQRPSDWHSYLSSALLSMMSQESSTNCGYRQRISALRLVPLQTGEWICSTSSETTLVLVSRGTLDIPRGLELVEVDPAAGEDPARRALFSVLGVREASAQLVCEMIASLHANPSFHPGSLLTADLVAHAKYYSCHHESGIGSKHERGQCPQLWLRAQDGEWDRGSELYIESSQEFSVRCWPDEFVNAARFLDRAYLSAHEGEKTGRIQWLEWLVGCQGVQIFPRLVKPLGDGFQLSAHFKTLLKTAPSSKILQLLKHQWSCYAVWVEDGGPYKNTSWERSRDRLVDEMGLLQVSCLDGTVCPLKDTLLPVKGLSITSPGFRGLLDVPNPDDPGWGFLRHFGVTATFDPRILLARLRELCASANVSSDQVSQVYFELQACDLVERATVRYVRCPLVLHTVRIDSLRPVLERHLAVSP